MGGPVPGPGVTPCARPAPARPNCAWGISRQHDKIVGEMTSAKDEKPRTRSNDSCLARRSVRDIGSFLSIDPELVYRDAPVVGLLAWENASLPLKPEKRTL